MKRLRNLTRSTAIYLASWRGAFFASALALSAALALIVDSRISTFAGTILLVGAVLILTAHEARRSEDRRKEIVEALPEAQEAQAVGKKRIVLQSQVEPLVTVVVTAHNEARFLAICLESVLAQRLTAWEAVIIDDASTDDTGSIALRFCEKDPRFRLVTLTKNVGLAEARNLGLAHTRTPFITFLDGDDFLFEESLSKRMAEMPSLETDPWVAGVFSNWKTVPEDADLATEPPFIADRGMVTWFDAVSDAPFISSAPLIRTDAVRRSGGFSVDFPTAEDTAMWNEILRNGWVFRSTGYTGVAYRMKRQSMYKRTAEAHTSMIEGIALSNNASSRSNPRVPFRFTEPYWVYPPRITRWRRLVGAAAAILESGANPEAVLEEIEERFEPFMAWTIDADAVASNAAARVTMFGGDETAHQRTEVRATLLRTILPLIDEARRQTHKALAIPLDSPPASIAENSLGSLALEARPAERQLVVPTYLAGPSSPVRGKVILLPAATYHMAEIGPLASALRANGVDSVVLADDRRWPSIKDGVGTYGLRAYTSPEAGAWLEETAAIVMLNDWGEYYREFADTGNAFGVPTFAKVEGVQDFNDDDVHWSREAYQRVSVVLAQGRNDAEALPGQTIQIVGSTRLERIWNTRPRRFFRDLAILNVNFTYGVLDDARALWISTVVEACDLASMPYVLSLHPAERDRYEGRLPVAREPIRHLLTYGSILISRFSTVPFEAMARGVPFIYHNPHGEKAPTFQNPGGAFEVSTDVSSLVSAIAATRGSLNSYREQCGEFFASQVDIDANRPSETRGAHIILNAIQ